MGTNTFLTTNRVVFDAFCELPDLDTNAAPLLLRSLWARPPLSTIIRSRLPLQVRRVLPPGQRRYALPLNQIADRRPEIFKASVPDIFRLTLHQDASVRRDAASLLGKFYTNAPSGSSMIQATLNHTDIVSRLACLSELRPVPTNREVVAAIELGLSSTQLQYRAVAARALVRLTNELLETSLSPERYRVPGLRPLVEVQTNDAAFVEKRERGLRLGMRIITNAASGFAQAVSISLENLSTERAFVVHRRTYWEPEIFAVKVNRPLTEDIGSGTASDSWERSRLSKPEPKLYMHGELPSWEVNFTIPPRQGVTWIVPLAEVLDSRLAVHRVFTNCSVFVWLKPDDGPGWAVSKTGVSVVMP
jgi:hypothetical protein